MDTGKNSNIEFRNYVYETLASHESYLVRINASILTIIKELQSLRANLNINLLTQSLQTTRAPVDINSFYKGETSTTVTIHVDLNKTTLTVAVPMGLAFTTSGVGKKYNENVTVPEERTRGLTIKTVAVEIETASPY